MEKIAIKRGRTVVNWMGYLLTAVPLQFEGKALERFRATQSTPNYSAKQSAPAFQVDELRAYLVRTAAELPEAYDEIAASLRQLATDEVQLTMGYANLEALDQWLTVLEEKMIAAELARQSEEEVLESLHELDRQLHHYRGKLTADQLSMLEKQYRERNLLEKTGLPRLSLFYMR